VGAPQSGQRRRMVELGRGPQRIARESSSGWVVNQGDQEKVVRHRRNWAAHGPQGKIESAVEHGPNSGIEETRRTMNSQRTANTGLTGCLSSGVHRIASVGVVVGALDESARAFYLHHEFIPLLDHPNRLFLAMATIEKAFKAK